MSQVLSQVMGHYMRLEQKLTPQLIQSMDILQLSTPDLEQRIAEELEKNVTLEVPENAPRSREDGQTLPRHSDGRGVGEDSASFNRLNRFTRDNHLDLDDRMGMPRKGRYAASGDRDAKMDAMANTACRAAGIDEHLMRQWVLLDVSDETRRAGEAIIYHLEDDGYLKTPLEKIAEDARPPLDIEVLTEALALVQKLDPVGIAARDYRECLLLQLESLPGDNAIERALIENHLDDVSRNRFPAIAKATGYTVGEITAAVEAVKHSLVLHPGYQVVDKRVPRVYPDVIVQEDERGKGLVVNLARGNLPELRIKQYLE